MIKIENKGIYLPRVNQSLCSKCGLCLKICPGSDVLFEKLNLDIFGKSPKNMLLGHLLNCYTGFSADYSVRFKSSSGGLVTALLIYALESGIIDGALVTRMKENCPLEPEPFIARTKQDLIKAARSKYCPVPANLALKEILETDGKYAIVGLPCHLHGIIKAQQLNITLKERIFLKLGLFCSTTVSFNGTELLLRKLHLSKKDVLKIDYRGNGWPGSMTIELKEKDEKRTIPYFEYSDSCFLAYAPWRCKLCIDHAAEFADISFGDAWIPKFISRDDAGTSILITRSQQGEEIAKSAFNNKSIFIDRINVEDVIKSQHDFSDKKIRILGRLKLSKTIGKKTPDYGITLGPCTPGDYFIAIVGYVKTVLAARKYTWWLLAIYCRALSLIGALLNKRNNLSL